MKEYNEKEIEEFLLKIDRHLEKSAEVIIIGGTAAILAYHISDATQDIDTWNSIDALKEAHEKAKKETGFDIPLSKTVIADPPYDFEDRLIRFKPEKFKKLIVKVPEVIDLILMKLMRGYAHDMKAIEEMVHSENVQCADLVKRFITEMSSAVTPERKRNLNFLAMIQQSFPKEDIEKIKRQITK